jgi:excisionase family DNA binding protein
LAHSKLKKFGGVFYDHHRKMISIELLTIAEVAVFLKLSKRTVYRLTVTKTIPGFKLGGQWRFNRAILERFVDEQEKLNGTESASNDKTPTTE